MSPLGPVAPVSPWSPFGPVSGAVAEPDSAIVAPLTVRVAVRAPTACGAKRTDTEQLSPASSRPRHPSAPTKKSSALVPVNAIPSMSSPPVLVITTVCGGLTEPCVVDANVRAAGAAVALRP